MNRLKSYHASVLSSKRGYRRRRRQQQRPAISTGHDSDEERGGIFHPQPGAFRMQGNRPSDNEDDMVSDEDSTVVPSVVEQDNVVRVPEAQLVDPALTEAGVARAIQEAREEARRALREELQNEERSEERQPVIRAELLQEKDEAQHATTEEEAEEEKNCFRMPTFIRKHAVVCCLMCFLLLVGAVGAGLGVAFSSSNKNKSSREGEGMISDVPSSSPTTVESPLIPTPRPTTAPVLTTTALPLPFWTRVGSTLRGVATGDFFGSALALSGDGTVVAVGARYNDDVANDAGYVQVFQRGNGTGQQQAEDWQPMGAALKGVAPEDWFGVSVALSSNGQILAVGASGLETDRPGYVRVFAYDSINNQWNPRGSTILGVGAYDGFGESVAFSSDGNILAVGAPYNDYNGYSGYPAGHVRVFAFNSNSSEWEQQGSTLTVAAGFDSFGDSLDLSADGGILAVSAWGDSDNGSRAGYVRAFQFNNKSNDWDPLGEAISGVAADNYFHGYFDGSVALSSNGMVLAAGAIGNDHNSGHVRVFDYNTSANQWLQRGSAIVVAASDQFGGSVALSADGNQVAASAIENDAIATSSGHVRVFQYEESSGGGMGKWEQAGAALAGVGGTRDWFGVSIAMSADGRVVAGGAGEYHSSSFEGPGYVCVYARVAE